MTQLQETESLRELVDRKLESEGTENPDVQQDLVEGAELLTDEEKVCQLCKIHRPPFSQGEYIQFETDKFYIVDTYDKKEHEIRNMAVEKEHSQISPVEENIEMLNRLVDITAGQIQNGEMVVYGSMETFSEHFHMVASDVYGEEPSEIQDLDDVKSYARFDIEDGEADYLEDESRYRDNFGDYLQQWIEKSGQ